MALSEKQNKYLRGLGHALKPVVTVGDAGLTASLLKELDVQIAHHELVKVRVRAAEREARDDIIARLAARAGAELITRTGNVALLYRRNVNEPRIVLPGR